MGMAQKENRWVSEPDSGAATLQGNCLCGRRFNTVGLGTCVRKRLLRRSRDLLKGKIGSHLFLQLIGIISIHAIDAVAFRGQIRERKF